MSIPTRGIVRSSQLWTTKRLDAGFNLAYQKFEVPLRVLLESVTREQLIAAVKALPLHDLAARVMKGNCLSNRHHPDRWTTEELALYLLSVQEDGVPEIAAEDIERKAMERVRAIRESTASVADALKHLENTPLKR